MRLTVPATGMPAFVLNDVSNFSVFRSKPVPDTELKTAQRQVAEWN